MTEAEAIEQPPAQEAAPSPEEQKAVCERYAWRFHKACAGRGWLLKASKVETCSCAWKRIARELVAAGELSPK